MAFIWDAVSDFRVQLGFELIALIVWNELGHRVLTRSGPRAVWGWMSVAVVVGTLLTLASTGFGFGMEVLAFSAVVVAFPVASVTFVAVNLRSRRLRLAMAAAVGVVTVPVGFLLGILALRIASCVPGPCPMA